MTAKKNKNSPAEYPFVVAAIHKYMREHGYDGVFCEEENCACGGELFLDCENYCSQCRFGKFLEKDPRPHGVTSCGGRIGADE